MADDSLTFPAGEFDLVKALADTALEPSRLIAALNAVLGLASRWAPQPGDPDWARTRARAECAEQIVEAVTRELLRENQ